MICLENEIENKSVFQRLTKLWLQISGGNVDGPNIIPNSGRKV